MAEQEVLIRIKNLYKSFPFKRKITDVIMREPQREVKAVDGVSLDIKKNEIISLVGESGCGKSSLARTIIRLYEPERGEIIYGDTDIAHFNHVKMQEYRKRMQMVFQDPYSSLNPRMKIREVLTEELLFHNVCTKDQVENKVLEIIQQVGLPDTALDRYPSEFSGGQRQRIGIARALAVNPEFIIADEPVSALDVSIQAQILNLLLELQKNYGLSILFISHDLRVVNYISDRVAVMYLGKIVEIGTAKDIYENYLHPYSEVLLKSAPNIDPRIRLEKPVIEGNPPSPIDILPGCRFCKRCKYAKSVCFEEEPELKEVKEGHFCACYKYQDI
ncbi:MAG: ABC transporter ATP-binding protein [Eubacteriales bacterium]